MPDGPRSRPPRSGGEAQDRSGGRPPGRPGPSSHTSGRSGSTTPAQAGGVGVPSRAGGPGAGDRNRGAGAGGPGARGAGATRRRAAGAPSTSAARRGDGAGRPSGNRGRGDDLRRGGTDGRRRPASGTRRSGPPSADPGRDCGPVPATGPTGARRMHQVGGRQAGDRPLDARRRGGRPRRVRGLAADGSRLGCHPGPGGRRRARLLLSRRPTAAKIPVWIDEGSVRDEAVRATTRAATGAAPRRRRRLPEDVVEDLQRAGGARRAPRLESRPARRPRRLRR